MATIRVYYRGDNLDKRTGIRTGEEVDEEYTMKTMTCEVNSGVALVTFTREKAMNSLSADFKHELMLLYEYLKRNDEIRAVVWTGKGRDFSAGADLTNSPLSLDEEVVAGYKRVGKGVFDDDEDAQRLGLINRVVPDTDVVAEAMKVATFFAGKDPSWFKKTKELMHKPILDLLKFEENLKLENDVFREHMNSGIPMEYMMKYMKDLAAAKKAQKAKQSKL